THKFPDRFSRCFCVGTFASGKRSLPQPRLERAGAPWRRRRFLSRTNLPRSGPTPPPSLGRVKVNSISGYAFSSRGVNRPGVGNWDEIVRVGEWDVGRRPPLALGVEAAGVVAAVGKDVTSLAPGDEVLTHPVPLRHQGSWAERLVAPATLVARKPAAVPWEAAAAFPVPALTADQALTEAAPVPA